MDPQERARLEAAYRATTYRVGKLRLRVGEPSPALDELLRRRGLDRWAFLTSVNPRSQALPSEENARRLRALRERLSRDGWTWLRAEAIPDAPDWEREPSVLVLGMGREEAEALAREWEQNAVVLGSPGGAAELVFVR